MSGEFNKSKRKKVLAHFFKLADETISTFCLQTTKIGNLPHLFFIQCKPEYLGTELKILCCVLTNIILHMEIQQSHTDLFGRRFKEITK